MDGPVVATDDKGLPRIPRFVGRLTGTLGKKEAGCGVEWWAGGEERRGGNLPTRCPLCAPSLAPASPPRLCLPSLALAAGQVEALWRDFFNDPVQFFDYREMKQHAEVPPKYPDFKKIATGEPLWVESRGTPPWVHDSLQKYDDAFAAALAGMPLEGQGGEEGAAGAGVEEQFQEEFGGGAMDARGF
ncbi:unnamed protein product [Closterium sp. NIES-65]|nr:unnamed protein product [Closterium sp. NIES-65]